MKIKEITNILFELKPGESKTNKSGTVILDLPAWVGYTFGSIFIVLGLAIFSYYPRSKRKVDEYKKEQLALYNKNRGTSVSDYSKTKLFLPFWEKVKWSSPIFLGLVFIILGIAWIAGNALSTKNFG